MAEVLIDRVSKRFGEIAATKELSLTIPDGEFVVLLGPTGAGKTTLLRLVAGLEQADAGKIVIDGRDATREPPALRDVSFVFQQYSLYPHLSVYDNLAFPLRAPGRRLAEHEISRRVAAIAQLVRIDHKLASPATRLSGGEMQRVAIGRALVRRPSIYLMDEPLSSLDAKLRADLRVELKHIQADLGATILYVTHDQTEAMTMASRIGILDQGRLAQVGTPREIYENPVSIHVAARLGTPPINLFPAGAIAVHDMPEQAVTIGARTEHIELLADAEGPAEVIQVEHLGSENHLHLKLNGHRLVTLAPPEQRWQPGGRARISLRKPLYFGATGQRIESHDQHREARREF
jgi:multiple sugar transport system ATP-binding protein